MTKKELRKIYLEKRRQLSNLEMDKLNDLILIGFQKLKLPPLQLIFIYNPLTTRNEPETGAIARYLTFLHPGLKITLPRINSMNGEMDAVIVEDHTLFKENNYGILEPDQGIIAQPEDIDLVIVPLLAFDKLGYRVGYGKGFYDKYLAHCDKNSITVGLSYFAPVEKIEDSNSFDVPLKYCITPDRVYEF